MRYLLSPNHFADQFKNGWTFSDKVDVFEDRIQGWQLDVAWNLAKLDIQNNQIAIIHLVSSYFEMIGKYIEGFLEDGSSQRYFKIGLRNVFPDLGEQEEIFMKSIYRNLRCGLYHLGRPAANVILNNDALGAIGYNEENGLIMISPTKLLGDIQANFNAYVKGLRHSSNPRLRANFEARFDHDNRLVISTENGSVVHPLSWTQGINKLNCVQQGVQHATDEKEFHGRVQGQGRAGDHQRQQERRRGLSPV